MKTSITENMIFEVTNDLIEIYATDKQKLTKAECKKILNMVFELLFDEKLTNKNFDCIFNELVKNKGDMFVLKTEIEPIVRSFIIGFNVTYITNSMKLNNDKICIKMGKHLLPIDYYLKTPET